MGAAEHIVSSLEDAGAGTLRAALAEAAEGDTVSFAPELFDGTARSLVLTSGPLKIERSLHLEGPGDLPGTSDPHLVIAGEDATRLLEIAGRHPKKDFVEAWISGIGFTGGAAREGGAVEIAANAMATFERCDFIANSAVHDGGAILNKGALVLDECLLANNAAGSDGGAIFSTGMAQITRSLFRENEAGYNGGGLTSRDEVRIESSTFSHNRAALGGGIAVLGRRMNASNGSLVATTFVGNESMIAGGGIFARGGGTVVRMKNSVFADNVAVARYRPVPNDLAAWHLRALKSEGYNLIEAPWLFPESASTDLLEVEADIGPLANNGGRTATHGFGPESPLFDAGDPDFAGELVLTDQRGQPRVAPGETARADIGAFELVTAEPTIDCPGTYAFECAGGITTGLLNATAAIPGGGLATVTWTVGGVPAESTTVELPSNGEAVALEHLGTFSTGTTEVEVEVLVAGYELTCGATVTVADTLPPEIELDGPSAVTLECGEEYIEYGATATDACGGELPVSISVEAVDPDRPGIYLVSYQATDAGGRTATQTRVVDVRDTTPPSILGEIPAALTYALTSSEDCAVMLEALPFSATAVDDCDPDPALLLGRLEGEAAAQPLEFPATFPIGTTTIAVQARDAAGNLSPLRTVDIVVADDAPPALSLIGPATVEVGLGESFVDPGVETADACSAPVELFVTVDGDPEGVVDTCRPGSYLLEYTAYDQAGNFATVAREVVVSSALAINVPSELERRVSATECTHTLALETVVEVTGLPADCLDALSLTALITTLDEETHVVALDEPFAFPTGTSTILIEAWWNVGEPTLLASAEFELRVDDPYYACLPNILWPLALPLDTPIVDPDRNLRAVAFEQVLTKPGESRWYKIKGVPGGQIRVFLENLPADYNIVVYGDIEAAYEDLIALAESPDEESQLLALLGAEFAPEAYFPEAYSPEAYSPEAYFPEAYFPEAYFPEAYSPEAYFPEAYAPEAYFPEAYSPEAYFPEAYFPEAYFPEAYFPEAYFPEAYSPEAYFPEAYFPEAYFPEAYAAAQQRSLVAFSATAGTSGERVVFNTYSRSGDYYIRVKGRNGIADPENPFSLLVEVESALCDGVDDTDTAATDTPSVDGAPTSLLVWDSTRIAGTPEEIAALAGELAEFAALANGVVLDVGLDPRVAALQAQSDARPSCPFAQNLVAEAIRQRILAYRTAAPSIADITLVGNDATIPFFRTNDEAGLASEANYFPPVFDDTSSQSSLRLAQVLTQDRYGALCQVYLASGPYDLPEIPVGRLVETAGEVRAYLAAYASLFDGTVSTGGLLPTPDSALAVGYDFLEDATYAVRDEFVAGLGAGGTVEELISSVDDPPALGWTADELRAAFLGQSHDITFLAGHFSTSGMLAADYDSRLSAGEVAASPVDLLYSLILSPGCHSGYSTVDAHAIPFVTEQPDWAQAFSRKGALFLSGTGYQYGDTDFVEYTERLQLEFLRRLRVGTEPVAIGRALVEAKRKYLVETPLMRGIHEKTLLQVALYGLPMIRLDLPGTRLTEASGSSDIESVEALDGPGAAYGLKVADLPVIPTLTRFDRALDVVGSDDETVLASFWEGRDGIVSLPGEPIRARQTYNLSRPLDGIVRGIGFRGGDYTDIEDIRPLSGAPATETRGVHGAFFSEVFYPQRQWTLNQIGELCDLEGTSLLNVFPLQYRSPDLTLDTGTARKFTRMDLEVFYCPVLSPGTLASPVAINLVSSDYEDGMVSFAIDVAVPGEIPVQAVWITYTGLPGSPAYGKWVSVDLEAPESELQIGTWTGSLPLPEGTDPTDLRFIVQAVNAVGVTTLNSNFGRYFKLDESTLDGVGTTSEPTSLSFVGDPLPTEGEYRGLLPVAVTLSDESGEPVSGADLRFSLGSVNLPATTDDEGLAAVFLPLDTRPGAYQLEVSFAGDGDYDRARVSQPFAVLKAPTRLTVASNAEGTTLVATVRALDGTPLKERTVLFVAPTGTSAAATTAITDGAGQARFNGDGLLPGTYPVEVYFGQSVEIDEGIIVPLLDPLYGPSSGEGSIFVPDTLGLDLYQVDCRFLDATAPGANPIIGGLSSVTAQGAFSLDLPDLTLDTLLGGETGETLRIDLSASVGDSLVHAGELTLEPLSEVGSTWRAEIPTESGPAAFLTLVWDESGRSGYLYLSLVQPLGTGPLQGDDPMAFTLSLTLRGANGDPVAAGDVVIGDSDSPWTYVWPTRQFFVDLR